MPISNRRFRWRSGLEGSAEPLRPPLSAERLLAASLLLTAELDKAGFFAAAACAAMAADRIGVLRYGPSPSSVPTQDERIVFPVEMQLTLDGKGQAWMVLEGDCHLLGEREAVCAELRRFLGEAAG